MPDLEFAAMTVPSGGPGIPLTSKEVATPSSLSLGDDYIVLLPETLQAHRSLRIPIWHHIWNAPLLVVLSAPLIYACAIPFVLLDLSVTLYQSICFPIYDIAKVRRKDYIVFDRGRLAYLNAIEKIGCVYCSYANGLLAYIAEIAARTELRFCPIQHAIPSAKPHSQYAQFSPYGDAKAYHLRIRQAQPLPGHARQKAKG